MVSFAAPGFLLASVAAALAITALHLFAWRRPPPTPMPTARFVPEHPVRAVSRAVRPSDLALLALRVLLVLFAGAALARPTLEHRADRTARVVVVDASRAVTDSSAARARAESEYRQGDALVVFDSTAREIASPSRDSLGVVPHADRRGSLSAALVVAARAAARLERSRDSVEIVLVSPVAVEELDAATVAIRRTWRGAVRIARLAPTVRAAADSGLPPIVRALENDPVAPAVALTGRSAGGARARIVRTSPEAADSAWASGGNVLVIWPVEGHALGWPIVSVVDTAFGVAFVDSEGRPADGGAATVVAPFMRRARPPPARVIARWSDGEPAVTEAALGSGCVRHVSVAVSASGDLTLGSSFRRFARRLTEPCGGARALDPAPDTTLRELVAFGAGRTARRTTSESIAAASGQPPSRLSASLLTLALAAALLELIVRQRGVRARA